MLSIVEVQSKAVQSFERNHARWAAELFSYALDGNSQSLQIDFSVSLKPPTEKEVLSKGSEAREWAQAWREDTFATCVEWVGKTWASVGWQEIPIRLTITSPEELANFAKKKTEWSLSKERCLELSEQWCSCWRARYRTLNGYPAGESPKQTLVDAVRKALPRILALDERDWGMLLMVLDWLTLNPDIEVYIRQLPIKGIDSKWMEQHKAVAEPLFRAITGRQGFTFAKVPNLYRVRFLESTLAPEGLLEMSLSTHEMNRLVRLPGCVFICENLISVLSFPEIENALAIHGGGYAVGALSEVLWLTRVPVAYWGDLDSNGFAILNQLRHHLPHAVSLMMDRKTLAQHLELCVYEATPNRGTFDRLTEEEHATLNLLLSGVQPLRLEQERIEWRYVLDCIATALQE